MSDYELDDTQVTADAMGQFFAHALEEYPREACGVFVLVNGVESYVRCQNLHPQPTQRFRFGDRDFSNAEKLGEVVAVGHSHPDGSPQASEADRTCCEASELPWRVVAVHRDGARVSVAGVATVEPSGWRAPLVGRQFVHGLHDCYTILQDWFRQERGLELPHFQREDEWWRNGGDLYRDNFRACGFEITQSPMEVGDIVLMQIQSPVPNHAGIYIGKNMMLHHMVNRTSRQEIYGGYWQKHTVAVLRYVEDK